MQSRVEKFKEYRKSMISGESHEIKREIETSIEATSVSSGVLPDEHEMALLKSIQHKKYFAFYALLSLIIIIFLTLLISGIIIFK